MNAPLQTVTTAPRALAFVRPTRWTVFWRTFVPWQLIRFVLINLKISVMILKSHDSKVGASTRARGG